MSSEGLARGAGELSCATRLSGARIAGIRSWIWVTKSFPSVVIPANVLIHSPDAGSFQFSHRPAMPNGEPTFSEKTFGAQGQLRMGMGPNGCRA